MMPIFDRYGFDEPFFRRVELVADQDSGRRTVEADPRSLVLVVRTVPRAALLRCPCGCGETLSVNLDPRVGKAWRAYPQDGTITLLPSIWRTTGCRSHFFIWRNDVFWCGHDSENDWLETADLAAVDERLRGK